MSLVNDIVSVENFVKTVSAGSQTSRQDGPLEPVADSFVIRFQNESRESETARHFRIEREYQIVYYGATKAAVLGKMDALSNALYQTQVIPINGSLRYIRVESFSFSQPVKTGNGLYAVIGVLSTEVRQARDQATYDKITRVQIKIN